MAVAAFLAFSLAAQEAADYFPLEPGMKWTYKLGNGNESVMSVQGDKIPRVVTGLGAWGVFNEEKALVVASTEGVTIQRVSKFPMALVWLKTPLKVGEAWTSKADFGDGVVEFHSAVEAEEEIEVPAGKYKGIRVKTVIKEGERNGGEMRIWYAKGVGEVRSAVSFGSNGNVSKIERQLVKFEKPGK